MKTSLNRGLGNKGRMYCPTAISERILQELSIINRAVSIEQISNVLTEKYAIKPGKVETFKNTIKASVYVLYGHNKIVKCGAKYSSNIKYKIKNGAPRMHQIQNSKK